MQSVVHFGRAITTTFTIDRNSKKKTLLIMNKFFAILLFMALHSTNTLLWGQEMPQQPCGQPEASQFDFWLGDWELTWNDTIKGSNLITKNMNGCVIHEHFNSPTDGFSGMSWSVFNPGKNKWEQTWVDNSGGYLNLEGAFSNGQMELSTEQTSPKGEKVLFKMVYYNIKQNEFDWEWKSSKDNGLSFEVLWKIHYQRKVAPPANEQPVVDDAYMTGQVAKMKTYTLLLLKIGSNRGKYTEDAANEIQAGHLKHIFEMKLSGKLAVVGPLLNDGDIRGIGIFNASPEEVKLLMAEDPAVKAGILAVEVYPWFGLPGDTLPE